MSYTFFSVVAHVVFLFFAFAPAIFPLARFISAFAFTFRDNFMPYTFASATFTGVLYFCVHVHDRTRFLLTGYAVPVPLTHCYNIRAVHGRTVVFDQSWRLFLQSSISRSAYRHLNYYTSHKYHM